MYWRWRVKTVSIYIICKNYIYTDLGISIVKIQEFRSESHAKMFNSHNNEQKCSSRIRSIILQLQFPYYGITVFNKSSLKFNIILWIYIIVINVIPSWKTNKIQRVHIRTFASQMPRIWLVQHKYTY